MLLDNLENGKMFKLFSITSDIKTRLVLLGLNIHMNFGASIFIAQRTILRILLIVSNKYRHSLLGVTYTVTYDIGLDLSITYCRWRMIV